MHEPRQAAGTPQADTAAIAAELLQEMQAIRSELTALNAHNVFGLHRLVLRALLMQFLKGSFFGLGSLLGATIVLSALVYFLSQMEVIPIIGSWVKQLNQVIQQP